MFISAHVIHFMNLYATHRSVSFLVTLSEAMQKRQRRFLQYAVVLILYHAACVAYGASQLSIIPLIPAPIMQVIGISGLIFTCTVPVVLAYELISKDAKQSDDLKHHTPWTNITNAFCFR